VRLLFLSRWFPYPPRSGSTVRIYHLLRGLARHHTVDLLSFDAGLQGPPEVGEMASFCRRVVVVPWKPFNPRSVRAQMGFLRGAPRSLLDTHSSAMDREIRRALVGDPYDLVIASQIDMAIYANAFGEVPSLLEELELGVVFDRYARAETVGRRVRDGLTWAKSRRFVSRQLRRFRCCTVVSERERRIVRDEVGAHGCIKVIPNFVDLGAYEAVQAPPVPNTLIFSGSLEYEPNREAMVWFVEEVLGKIEAEIPEVRLTITGSAGNRGLPPRENVILSGFVPDVRPMIAGAWVSLAPLRTGGGTRVKILESMALGTPVVATSKGAEGIEATTGHHLLVADTPTDFSAAVVRLLKDPVLRQGVAARARELVRLRYDLGVVLPQVLDLVERVAGATVPVMAQEAGSLAR
jgi:polysaccharide biosynthesis protein PslH